MNKKQHLKLFNRRYGITGDMTYGANGLLYQLIDIPTKLRLEWTLIDSSNESDYLSHLLTILDKYETDTQQNHQAFLESSTATGQPKKHMLSEFTKSIKNIHKGLTKLLSTLFPKRHDVRNFGKGSHAYLEEGFASYLLFRVLHYYGIALDKIGIKTKTHSKKDISGLKFFNDAMKFIDNQTEHIFKKHLKKDDIHTIDKMTWPKKIQLLSELLKKNIENNHNKESSEKYLIELIHIKNLLKSIIKFNIVKKSYHLRYYFDLFRLLHIDLVSVIDFISKYVPGMHLVHVPGTINGQETGHPTGMSRIGFGYALYYLIENEYINENDVWDWII